MIEKKFLGKGPVNMTAMTNLRPCINVLLMLAVSMFFTATAAKGDENLALYGLKGYAYTYSPLPSNGFNAQTGVMYSRYRDKIHTREGYIWVFPLSLTYGDGDWWEVSAATHYELWENTDPFWDDETNWYNNSNPDVDRKDIGDVFIGGKARLLGHDRGYPLDLSVMPYVLLPTGNHAESIGDLFLFNPTDEDDYSYGLNLLLGRRLNRVYLSANIGINHVDSDLEYIEKTTFFTGLAAEYHITESLMAYAEFYNNENKNRREYPYIEFGDTGDDMREIGAGIVGLKNKWGFKLHAATGLSDTTPDFRIVCLVNLSFPF